MAKAASDKAAPEPRKGMPDPAAGRGGVPRALPRALRRSRLRAAGRGDRADRDGRLGRLRRPPQEPGHPQGRPGLRRSRLRPLGRLDRRARRDPRRRGAARRRRAAARPPRQRLVAQRAHLPGRDVEELAAGRDRARGRSRQRPASRSSMLDLSPARLRVRPPHPPLQGLLLDRGAALPLALLLLPEPFARPDAGLDERHLPDVGRGARRHDRHAGQLVPGRPRR